MKKKILAGVLAAVMVFHIGGELTRPKAAAAASTGITLCVAALELLGIMMGDSVSIDISEAVQVAIENGIEGEIGLVSFLKEKGQHFFDGWQIIYNTMVDMFESGSISINDNSVVMKYSEYLELCNLVGSAFAEFNITLGSDIPYIIFKCSQGATISIDNSISINSIDEMSRGMSYAPIYYTDEAIYFADKSLSLYCSNDSYNSGSKAYIYCNIYQAKLGDAATYSYKSIFNGSYSLNYEEFFVKTNFSIATDGSLFSVAHDALGFVSAGTSSASCNWYKYDGLDMVTCTSTPDFSNMQLAYLNCRGSYPEFLLSVTDYAANVSSSVDIDDLSDPLSDVLAKTSNPTLEIDTDPAIVNPVDSVTVSDIPGEADVPLSDLMAGTRLDLDVPSVLADKFPFCIPFDFIRILSVLCAEPKAPIFRIPISTDPSQLEAFKGNQTIGEIPEDFEPMFDIDEEIVIDLSVIPLVQPICYSVFIIGFVILLIYLTPKMINH